MVGNGAHGVVGDAGWVGAAYPGRIGEEGVESAVAALEEASVSNLLQLSRGNLNGVTGRKVGDVQRRGQCIYRQNG